jgi:hypothetical protein
MPSVTFLDPRSTRDLARHLRAGLPMGWPFPVTTHNISREIVTQPAGNEARVHAGARNQQPWEQA